MNLVQGECDVCGLPGVVGMSCSDPDCPGAVKDLGVGKVDKAEGDDETERYTDDMLKDTEDDEESGGLIDNHKVISLDDLEKEESDDDSELTDETL